MHIILLKFTENKSDAPTHMEAHNAWIAKGMGDGIFKCVGSLDVGGGFILAHGEDTASLNERIAQDPFVEHGVVSATHHQVDVKKTAPELAFLTD